MLWLEWGLGLPLWVSMGISTEVRFLRSKRSPWRSDAFANEEGDLPR